MLPRPATPTWFAPGYPNASLSMQIHGLPFPEINFKIKKLSFIFMLIVFKLPTRIKPVAVIKGPLYKLFEGMTAHCKIGFLPNTVSAGGLKLLNIYAA